MTEIILSQAAHISLEAALRVRAGTITPWMRDAPFWDECQIPHKIDLGEVGIREGWGSFENHTHYSRRVQLWGMVGGQSKCLVRLQLVTSTQYGAPPPDDNHRWSVNEVRYLGLVRDRENEGRWIEKEHFLSLGQPILGP